jgi:hypothetical protein
VAETISISHRHTACCQRFIVLLFGVSGDHHHNVTDASSKLRHLKREGETLMSKHGYEAGRLNLPFVGLCSFGKFPYQPDWGSIDADFAVLGAPFDFGTQFRAGARFGPRGIREASTLFSFGHAGAYDHEDDVAYLEADKIRIVDIGDADIVHT